MKCRLWIVVEDIYDKLEWSYLSYPDLCHDFGMNSSIEILLL
jgi:hypothetical protein